MTKPSKYDHPADQQFDTFDDWIRRDSSVLTQHPEYNSTEFHSREAHPGWQGHHFAAMCFDQLGRRCRIGADFQRADAEGAFPVWWVWPDQIAERLGKLKELESLRESQLLEIKVSADTAGLATELERIIKKHVAALQVAPAESALSDEERRTLFVLAGAQLGLQPPTGLPKYIFEKLVLSNLWRAGRGPTG